MYIRKEVGFRPIEEKDLEDLRELRNDPTAYLNLGKVGMESVQSQFQWWSTGLIRPHDQRYVLFEVKTGKLVGQLRVNNIDYENAHCEIGLDILQGLRGRGYGWKSYECVLEYLFKHKNIKTVYLRVGEFNKKAIALYEKLGFTTSGFYKNYLFRNGKYHNYLLYSIDRDDYSCL